MECEKDIHARKAVDIILNYCGRMGPLLQSRGAEGGWNSGINASFVFVALVLQAEYIHSSQTCLYDSVHLFTLC